MVQTLVGREYAEAVTKLVQDAKQSIKMLVYDWRWYSHDIGSKIQKFNQEIIKQANVGVVVDVLVNSDFIGVHIENTKVQVKQVDSAKIMHAKMMVFDNAVAVVGSHNLTKNGFELNHEVSVVFDDVDAVARCVKFFEALK